MSEQMSAVRFPDFVQKYLDGTCAPEEEKAAREWLCAHITDHDYDRDFDIILENTTPVYDDRSTGRSLRALCNFISYDAERNSREKKIRRSLRWCAAAALAAAFTAVSLLLCSPDPVQWHEIYAENGQTERVTLSDGTSLWVNSGSKVIYPSRFDSDTRTIYIDGEIHADVTPDKHKPFIVSASDIRVKVHGTQFSVKAFAEMDNVEVALVSGSVTMEDSRDHIGVSRTLRPGEFLRYNKTYGTIEEYRINTSTYGAWQNNRNIRFINQSLKDIAEDLERRFDVNILIEDDTLAKTQYYASFINNEGLDKILQALNSNGSMKITKKHDIIVISPIN